MNAAKLNNIERQESALEIIIHNLKERSGRMDMYDVQRALNRVNQTFFAPQFLSDRLNQLELVEFTDNQYIKLTQKGWEFHSFFDEKMKKNTGKTEFIKKGEIFYPKENQNNYPTKQEKIMTEQKIFISHSSLDAKIVEKVIDLLEAIGVPSNQIFCSSFEGYGVKLGSDFLDVIKEELDSNVMVLFVLSSNFYSSIVSLCEMGATWVKTNQHIPILIPPFDYGDIKGVIPTTHGMKINEKDKLNSLKDSVIEFIGIKEVNSSVWERRRDNILKEIKKLIDSGIPETKESTSIKSVSQTNHIELEEYYKNQVEKIKALSKKEWPEDFEMQLDYIQRQKRAIEKLETHNPIDISESEFKRIRKNGRNEWPDDFEMQLDFEQRQVESLRRLNEI